MSGLLSAHREYLESLQRLGNEHIDNCLERLVLAGARGLGCMIDRELAMGARASFQNLARLCDLAAAVKGFLVLGSQLDHLFEQFGISNDLAFTEIDQALIEAVALCPPTIFVHQHCGITPPALIVPLEAPKHPQ